MQPWSDLLEEVTPEVEGCPFAAAERACVRAARKLCDHAPVLQESFFTNVFAGQRAYEFAMSPDLDAVTVLHGWFDGRAMAPLIETYTWNRGQQRPFTYQVKGEQVTLLWEPTADMANGLQVTFSLKPSFISRQGDDLFFGDYRESVIEGALAHLMLMPGREWSNAELGALHARAFTGEIQQANGRANKRHTTADISVRMRPMASGTRRAYV